MKVVLLNWTPEPEKMVAAAARLCYSNASIGDIVKHMEGARAASLINKLLAMGHMSPLEHASFTFGIEGVSRALSHQLVRHRLASYSQKSQRYVAEKGFGFVIPPSIETNAAAKERYLAVVEEIRAGYLELATMVDKEDARYLLPNACHTSLVMTMNGRSLHNFFRHRCCNRAQWEIRRLAWKMLALVREQAPALFAGAGAPCDAGQGCPEGDMSCGRWKAGKGNG